MSNLARALAAIQAGITEQARATPDLQVQGLLLCLGDLDKRLCRGRSLAARHEDGGEPALCNPRHSVSPSCAG